jgi:hypothetical protein
MRRERQADFPSKLSRPSLPALLAQPALLGQRSHTYTSLGIVVKLTVLIHRLTVLSKTFYSDQLHTALALILDGDQQIRKLQLRMLANRPLLPACLLRPQALWLHLQQVTDHTPLHTQLLCLPSRTILSVANPKALALGLQILLRNTRTCKRSTIDLR